MTNEDLATVLAGLTTQQRLLDLEGEMFDVSDRLDRLQVKREGQLFEVPPFDYETAVPLAEELQVLSQTQEIGTTHAVISWSNPDPGRVDHFEIWAKNATAQSDQPYMIASVEAPPAAFSLESDQDTSVAVQVRTVMKDGLGSTLAQSPSVGLSITHAPPDIPDGSIGDAKLDRITDPIQITAADITSLNADQINAGTLNVGVILASNIAASQISAGTLTSVNVSAGTYSLISGSNQMTIDGTNGFRQYHSSDSQEVKILLGEITLTDTGGSPNLSTYVQAGKVFTNHGANVSINIDNNSGRGAVVCYNTIDSFETCGMAWDGSNQPLIQANGTTNADLQAVVGSNNAVVRSSSTAALNGLYVNGNQVVGPRGSTISDPTGGSTIDSEARTAINALIDRLQAHGLIS